jgi:tetratricopeptide (TPR) repeat protein
MEAIDQLRRLARRQLLNQPGMEALRGELLAKVVTFYQRFAERGEKDGSLPELTAMAYRGLGDVSEVLGKHLEAAEAYAKASAVLEKLTGDRVEPANAKRWHERFAAQLGRWAALAEVVGREKDADDALAGARAALEKLIAAFPGEVRYQRDLAATYTNEGVNLHLKAARAGTTDGLDRAEKSYRLALKTLDELPASARKRPEILLEEARAHKNLAAALAASTADRRRVADEEYRLAQSGLDAALAGKPGDLEPECRKELGEVCLNRGVLQSASFEEAYPLMTRAVDLFDALTKQALDVAEDRYLLAAACRNRGDLLRRQGRADDARADYRRARPLLEALKPQFGEHPDYRLELAQVYLNEAEVVSAAEATGEEAAQAGRRVLDLYEGVVVDRKNKEVDAVLTAAAGRVLAEHDRKARQATEAQRWPECVEQLRALATVRRRLAALLPTPAHQGELASTQLELARVLLTRLHRHREAAQALDGLAEKAPSWDRHRAAAVVLVGCMREAERDPALTREEQARALSAYGDAALAELRAALARDWRDLDGAASAEEFSPLRGRAEFRDLLRQVEARKAAREKCVDS